MRPSRRNLSRMITTPAQWVCAHGSYPEVAHVNPELHARGPPPVRAAPGHADVDTVMPVHAGPHQSRDGYPRPVRRRSALIRMLLAEGMHLFRGGLVALLRDEQDI